MNLEKRKKTYIQIILILTFVLFFHFFIDAQIYRPLVKEYQPYMESDGSISLFSLSLWVLAVSLFYWIYPQKVLTNFIVAMLPVLTVVMTINIYHNFFFDFFHWIPLITGYILFIKNRKHLDMKLLLFTFLFLIWGLFACLFTTNYSYINPYGNGIIFAIVWVIISFTLLKLSEYIDKKSGKLNNLIKKVIN